MFFPDSALFCASSILQILRMLFPCNFFCQSWETVALVENLCFQQRLSGINLFEVLTTLISLWWVSYEGSFQVCEGRWWKKIQECQELKLGDTPDIPQEIFKETQASKLGDAPMHPLVHQQLSVRPSSHYFYCFLCYVLCLEHLALYFLV